MAWVATIGVYLAILDLISTNKRIKYRLMNKQNNGICIKCKKFRKLLTVGVCQDCNKKIWNKIDKKYE